MKRRQRVLITGAGGAAAPWLVRNFRAKGVQVFMADMDAYAAGLYLADKGFVVPPGLSKDFVPVVRDICRHEGIDVLIPLVDEELIPLADADLGDTRVLLPRLPFVSLCLDKYELMQQMRAQGLDVPATRLASEGPGDLRYPLIMKPRTGRGSRGLHRVQTKAELDGILADPSCNPGEYLLQEQAQGVEFTVSVVAWRDGAVQAVVPKEIICKRGITKLAVTRSNKAIEEACAEIQHVLNADGPFNVQLILEAGTERVMVFEINPRFSTTTTLTAEAGVDEMYGLFLQALQGPQGFEFGPWREGVVLVARTMDQFMSEHDFLQARPIEDIGSLRSDHSR